MVKTAGQIASRYYSQQCFRLKMKYLLICGTPDNSINALLSVTHGLNSAIKLQNVRSHFCLTDWVFEKKVNCSRMVECAVK